jgi:hypothetical protein
MAIRIEPFRYYYSTIQPKTLESALPNMAINTQAFSQEDSAIFECEYSNYRGDSCIDWTYPYFSGASCTRENDSDYPRCMLTGSSGRESEYQDNHSYNGTTEDLMSREEAPSYLCNLDSWHDEGHFQDAFEAIAYRNISEMASPAIIKDSVPLSILTATSCTALCNIESFVNRSVERRRKEQPAPTTKAKRPLNSFFLYRKAYHGRLKALGVMTQNEISKVCGKSWSMETNEVKGRYLRWGKMERDRHLEAFPDYQYRPRKSKLAYGRRRIRTIL